MFRQKMTQWYVAFGEAKLRKMNREEADIFLRASSAEMQGAKPPFDLNNLPEDVPMSVRMFSGHARRVGLKINALAALFVSSLCETPGQIVMYVAYLRAWQTSHYGSGEIDMNKIGMKIFSHGVPTDEELSRLWSMQKEGGANMLDMLVDGRDFPGQGADEANPNLKDQLASFKAGCDKKDREQAAAMGVGVGDIKGTDIIDEAVGLVGDVVGSVIDAAGNTASCVGNALGCVAEGAGEVIGGVLGALGD